MTKLRFAFRNFTKASRNVLKDISLSDVLISWSAEYTSYKERAQQSRALFTFVHANNESIGMTQRV
jgi:hypothetical protein